MLYKRRFAEQCRNDNRYHINYLKIGKVIRIEIGITPPCFLLQGTIEKTEENSFIVKINIGYIQKEPQEANCTIINDTMTQVCQFKTTIKHAENNLLTLVVPDEKDMQIVQRRRYIRVPINKEVDCYLTGLNYRGAGGDKIFSATVKNIGGDGVLLNSPLSLPAGTISVFEIELDNIQFLLTVKVLRAVENVENGTNDLGCQFVGISDADRQKIIAYCNKRQLALKRKNRRRKW